MSITTSLTNIKMSVAAVCIIFLCTQCNQPATTNTATTATSTEVVSNVKPIEVVCHLLTAKDSIKRITTTYSNELPVLLAVNRTDAEHIVQMDTVIIPANLSGAVNQYSPFPQAIPYANIKKLIIFSYPAQYFAAYENGLLVRSGPTNMGREKDPTPTGLFYTNWKAEKTKSTFNDEWELKWNFNIENKEGVGFHQYAMPGYPASHSCLRLQEEDAKFLYTFAEEWKLKGTDEVLAKGTPVLIFGSYTFGGRKPWLQLVNDPHTLDISEATLKPLIDAHIDDILAAQVSRQAIAENK